MAGRIPLDELFASFAPSEVPSTVTVYEHGTTTDATLYTSKTEAADASNPVTVDAFGDLFNVYAAVGDYDVVFEVNGETVTETVTVREDPEFVDMIQSVAPSSGSTLAIDASLGSIVVVSPTSSISTTTVTNLQVGQEFTLDFVSDGTHTFAYPTICKFAGGTAGSASSTSGYRDRYVFNYDGTHLIEKSRSLAIH